MLKMIKISPQDEENDKNSVFDYPAVNSYRMNDISAIPTDATGFTHSMLSNDKNHINIGETACVSQRIILHKSGVRAKKLLRLSNDHVILLYFFVGCINYLLTTEKI